MYSFAFFFLGLRALWETCRSIFRQPALNVRRLEVIILCNDYGRTKEPGLVDEFATQPTFPKALL